MGGIVIDIWEKSNFFGSIGSQKCTKNAIFPQGGLLKPPPASCRVKQENDWTMTNLCVEMRFVYKILGKVRKLTHL